MKLSRKKAIALCIELWTWLAETGGVKEDWPGWKKYKYIINDCWFCQHSSQNGVVKCNEHCIYSKKYGHCNPDRSLSYFGHWFKAKTPKTSKKYAKLFLEQIKTIK